MNDSYCNNCKKKVPVWMREKKTTIKYVTRMTTYDEAYAVCQFCGKEVYDPKVADMNVRRLAFALSASQA